MSSAYFDFYIFFSSVFNLSSISIMAPAISKKRKVVDGKTARPKKKVRKQQEYHSSSDEDEDEGGFQAVNLGDSDDEVEESKQKQTKSLGSNKGKKHDDSDGDNDSDDDAGSATSNDESAEASSDMNDDDESGSESSTTKNNQKNPPKRNNPTAFSTSITKILSTKLPTTARADPVLSRSKTATQTTSDLANEKLDKLARAKLKAEKKEELDRGRIRDVMGIEQGKAGVVAEEEKRLRKISQRGVVKLFNAVRTAQVRGEEAIREERRKGTIGIDERAKASNEMSKQGFLELINGKKGRVNIEEA